MSPVTPAMTRAILISENDNWCVVFQKIFKAIWYTYKLIKYMFSDPAGEITTQDATATFGQDVCNLTCPED